MNELADQMGETALRAMVHHQQNLIDRLLSEREGHLVSVEQAFRRRHNDQQKQIAKLEKLVLTLKSDLNQRRKAS